MEITVTWHAASKGNNNAATEDLSPDPLGQETWTIPMIGDTGYLMKLQVGRKGYRNRPDEPFSWELTANRKEFESRKEFVPIGEFVSNGWSYSGGNRALFPNQVQRRYRISDLEAAAKDPPSIELFVLNVNGKQSDASLIANLSVTLHSEGPATIGADTAQSIIIRQRPDLLMPYDGGGKYGLQPNADTESE